MEGSTTPSAARRPTPLILTLCIGLSLAVIFTLQAPGSAGPPPRQSCPSATVTPGGQTPTATPCPTPTPTPTPNGDIECRDGIDNDGDGKVDHPTDPGCANPNDDQEAEGSPTPTAMPTVTASSTVTTTASPTGSTSPSAPPGAKQCEDNIDNDSDGKVDHPADPDCANPQDDSEATTGNITPVPSAISIEHRLRPRHRFRGAVTSPDHVCVAGRRVVVKKVRAGRDLVVARTTAGDKGRWKAAHNKGRRGRYYAVARVAAVGDINCLKAVSSRVRARR